MIQDYTGRKDCRSRRPHIPDRRIGGCIRSDLSYCRSDLPDTIRTDCRSRLARTSFRYNRERRSGISLISSNSSRWDNPRNCHHIHSSRIPCRRKSGCSSRCCRLPDFPENGGTQQCSSHHRRNHSLQRRCQMTRCRHRCSHHNRFHSRPCMYKVILLAHRFRFRTRMARNPERRSGDSRSAHRFRFRRRTSRNPAGRKWGLRRTFPPGTCRLHSHHSSRPRRYMVLPPGHKCCFRTRRSHWNRYRAHPTSPLRTVPRCNCRHRTSNNLQHTLARRPRAHRKPCRRFHLRSGSRYNTFRPIRWQPAVRKTNQGRMSKTGVRGREKDSFRT